MKSHLKIQGAPCIFCDKTFSTLADPNDHVRSHIKEKPYCCTKCSSSFSKQGNLSAHKRTVHFKKFNLECEICGKFITKSSAEAHVRSHLTEKPYQCQLCGKRLKSSAGLKYHLKTHEEGRQFTFKCSICNKSYSALSNLRRHEKDGHKSSFRQIVKSCIFCEKVFPNKIIKSHIKSHLKEKPYACSRKGCEEEFANKNDLAHHLKLEHSRFKSVPVACVFCEKVFPTRPRVESHLKQHILEKPFDCPECPKSFLMRGYLVVHLRRVHFGERPFPCGVCGKMFGSRSHSQRHVATHLNEKPFACNFCGMRFRSREGYNKHLKSHVN
ncbi:unnamed protein product [Orchesella dallaii]|uniref:C2H2-type domain-containing protein n=1 Tax=Orchesella dallaii TaxID=48710 RepID=A0ABP1RQ27_9HEXA